MKKVGIWGGILLLGFVGWKLTQRQSGKVLGANTDGLKERLVAIGLPALIAEGNVLHTHQHLDLYIEGEKIQIPANVGIGLNDSFIAPIHTHDTTGIIHVESPTVTKYYLEQFLRVWGEKFPNNCQYYVNGSFVGNDSSKVELAPLEEIAMVCGRAVQAPATYNFPVGY